MTKRLMALLIALLSVTSYANETRNSPIPDAELPPKGDIQCVHLRSDFTPSFFLNPVTLTGIIHNTGGLLYPVLGAPENGFVPIMLPISGSHGYFRAYLRVVDTVPQGEYESWIDFPDWLKEVIISLQHRYPGYHCTGENGK